eukprot:CAMPEP_0179296042 /NCGR_PEP_ID=MMETSP0797-20121207/44733_1 /TAXON_ID=47934 /ORGANISM="Dinophysis acuminata, Strain DAEP01" /LENGTH=95 /DNA_ID=CAMNT_0021005305 /DNA_START=16 /DNA_END=304 /DNA_ORIENTATION=-
MKKRSVQDLERRKSPCSGTQGLWLELVDFGMEADEIAASQTTGSHFEHCSEGQTRREHQEEGRSRRAGWIKPRACSQGFAGRTRVDGVGTQTKST